jgi:ATP-dependent Clp protease ATP-binding subunit ClpA
MFERFTTQARQSIQLALSEARAAGASRIGAEHLLLGIAHARSGAAAEALAAAGVSRSRLRTLMPGRPEPAPLDSDALALLGIDLDQVTRAAEAAFGPGALDRPAAAPTRATRARMTAQAKESLASALRLAQDRHEGSLSAGHLLAGIIDQGDNGALRLLSAAGVDPIALRADVVRRMATAA